MSEIGDQYKAIREIMRQEGSDLRAQSEAVFVEARQLADNHGLDLRKHTNAHYSIRKPGEWQIDLYPGKQRIRRDRNMPAPFLDVGDEEWTVLDAVRAAVKQ
jgi:hypothetical protein